MHGVTGFLSDCDEALAHHAATLTYDEDLRQMMNTIPHSQSVA